jgi:hypothetical protein
MAVWDKDTQAFRHYANLHETSLLVLKDGSIVTSDNPLPVTIGGESITITGEVTIPGSIEISNDHGSPIPTHAHLYDGSDNEYSASNPLPVTIISEPAVSIDGDVNVTQGSSPWVVGGTVALDSTTIQMLQQVTATVSGSVTVDEITNAVTIQDGGNSITVDGSVSVSNFPATQTVDGTVGISGDVNVTQGTDPWTVDGTVDVGNFPATQTVDGTVTIQDGGGSITVDGSVTVGNFPASQTVDGTVNIGTMPNVTINQPVAVTDNGGSLTVDGSVSVSNFPATQTVDGTVNLSASTLSALENTTVSVSNFPASQTVDGTVDIGNEVAINDGGNTISIDDGGGSITIDGNVNATITGTPTFTSEPFELQVAKGNIAGHSVVHRSGFNPEIDKNSDPESIWSAGGLYPWIALNAGPNLYCVSSNSSDQEDLVINGLDENYDDITETINMNGTTGVTTTNRFRRINSVHYEGISINQGTIQVKRSDSSGAVLEQIEPDFSNALSMHYSVPAGKTAYLNRLTLSLQESKKGAQIIIYIRYFGENFRANHVYEISEGTSNFEWPYPERLPEKSDIDIVVYEAYENDTKVSGCIDFVVVDND